MDSTASVGHSAATLLETTKKHKNWTTNTYLLSTLLPRGIGHHGPKAYEVVPVCGAKAAGVMAYPADEGIDIGLTTP